MNYWGLKHILRRQPRPQFLKWYLTFYIIGTFILEDKTHNYLSHAYFHLFTIMIPMNDELEGKHANRTTNKFIRTISET